MHSNCFIRKTSFQSVCSGSGGYQYLMDSFDKGGSTRTVVPLHTGPNGIHSSTDLLCISAGCICAKGHRKGTELTQVMKIPQYEFSISNTFEVRLLY